MTTKRRCFSIDDVIGLLDGDDEEVMASDSDEDYEDLMTEESEDEAEANDLDNEVNNTAAAGPCIHGLDANEIVSALDASAEGYTNQDRTGDLQGDAEDPQPSIRRAKRGRKKCTETHSQKKSSSIFQARSTEAFQNTVEPTCNHLDGDLQGDEENTSEPPPHTKKQKRGGKKGNDTLQQKKWSTTLEPIIIKPFEDTVGPTFLVSSSPAEVLSFLFVNELVETIVDETNMYAERMMEPAKFAKWKQVDMQEIKAYLGFNMLMGLVQMPEIEDYWKTDPHFYYAPIATRISRTRFKEITRYLHFTDNTSLVPRGQRGHDKLGKVRPVITAVSSALLSSYNMGNECVVDEAMIAFQGRWCLKQYLPKKPIKRGIKAWCLADSSNGYIQKFEVYTGRNDTGEQENGLGTRVVISLTQHLQGKHHHVFCDNFFTSAHLLEQLLANGIYANGTIRQNSKGFPEELKIPARQKKKPMERIGLGNSRCGSTHRDLGRRQSKHWPGDVAVCRNLKRRQSGHWPGDVAVCTGTWGGDSQDTGQEMWQYSQGPGEETDTGQEMWQYVQEPEEETVRALARRCGSMYRNLKRRQSGHWPGDVAVLTGTWGGDSQGTGQEMWQYSQGPGEETVRALARRCGSMYRDLGRRQSGHWPGNVAVLTGTWGGDSQGTGPEMWQYVQEPGEETVRTLARKCGSTDKDLGRRQSGHWPGDVAVLTGIWGGDSQGTGQEIWQYAQGPGEETVRALARRCGSMYRDLGRRQSGHWPGNVAVLTGTWGGDSQGTGQEMWQYAQRPGEETVRALARRCGSTHRDLGRRQSGPWPVDVTVLSDLGRRQSGHWPGDVTGLTGTSGGDSQTGKNCEC
ncbi:hypothetical protein EMCRGX_G005660 [Ephydatia muelleri]